MYISLGHVTMVDLVLKSIKLACCGSSKLVPVTPLGTLAQMTDLRYFSPDVTVGGSFLPNFQTKLKFDKIYI